MYAYKTEALTVVTPSSGVPSTKALELLPLVKSRIFFLTLSINYTVDKVSVWNTFDRGRYEGGVRQHETLEKYTLFHDWKVRKCKQQKQDCQQLFLVAAATAPSANKTKPKNASFLCTP